MLLLTLALMSSFFLLLDQLTPQAQTPWVPALAADTLATNSAIAPHHEPLLSVRAVETGVIDVSSTRTGCTVLRAVLTANAAPDDGTRVRRQDRR